MTVRELRAKLKEFDQSMEVFFPSGEVDLLIPQPKVGVTAPTKANMFESGKKPDKMYFLLL